MQAPGLGAGRYSSHRRASSVNDRAASSRCGPSSDASSVLAADRIWPGRESAAMLPVYQGRAAAGPWPHLSLPFMITEGF